MDSHHLHRKPDLVLSTFKVQCRVNSSVPDTILSQWTRVNIKDEISDQLLTSSVECFLFVISRSVIDIFWERLKHAVEVECNMWTPLHLLLHPLAEWRLLSRSAKNLCISSNLRTCSHTMSLGSSWTNFKTGSSMGPCHHLSLVVLPKRLA